MQLRRRSSRPLLGNFVLSARPSLRLYDLELDPTAREEEGEWASEPQSRADTGLRWGAGGQPGRGGGWGAAEPEVPLLSLSRCLKAPPSLCRDSWGQGSGGLTSQASLSAWQVVALGPESGSV